MGFSVNRRNSLRSPHVRGKAQRRLHQLHQLGITPACAGKSQNGLKKTADDRGSPPACAGKSKRRDFPNLLPRDHPRVCGEKCTNVCRRTHHKGSPPRVRGKANVANPAFNVARITPACAGKRVDLSRTPKPAQDHPRVCGEKATHGGNILSRLGSPPRVRGKGLALRLATRRLGITPACAGKRVGTS